MNSETAMDQGIQREATNNQHASVIGHGSNISECPELNLQRKTMGGCGLSSLVSSPTENYTFYAKTVVRANRSCK